eukprot:GFUD01023806.1.p1 GENE.GFUD01023806.1~~GFUD01023806.1.p1  ORF type:complete len:327 (-),score=121.09 GFUD01023806.1:75-941(-)
MVQIRISDNEKETSGGVSSLLPTTDPEVRKRTEEIVSKRQQRSSVGSFSTTLLVILAIFFTLTTVKQICDLKEQNFRLMQQLAFERQKDAALKLAVRDNIPENKFIQHSFNSVEAGLVEAEGKLDQPSSTWSINLSVLWTSPMITPCDMARLSHILAEEIYAHQEERMNQMNPWSDVNEIEAEQIIGIKTDLGLPSFFKSETEETNENGNKDGGFSVSSEEWNSSEELIADEFSFLQINSDDDEGLNPADIITSEELEYFWNEVVLNDSEEFELFGFDSPEMEYYGEY